MQKRRRANDAKYKKILKEQYDFDFYDIRDMVPLAEHKGNAYFIVLKGFKGLFSQGEEAQIFLWNQIYRELNDYDYGLEKMDKTDFSAEEWKFLERIVKVYQDNEEKYGANVRCERNINGPIETDRLILTPHNAISNVQYISFFRQHQEEFEWYYGGAYDEIFSRNGYGQTWRNLSFAILLKDSEEFIGDVTLGKTQGGSYNLEYIIMPHYRQKGYAYEAVWKLLDEVLHDRLFILEETLKVGVFQEVNPPIQRIVAKINVNNAPSIKLIEKLGFKKGRLLKNHRKLHDNYQNYRVYTLKKTMPNHEEFQTAQRRNI